MKYRYRNSWHKPDAFDTCGPAYHETDAEPVAHAGCLIHERVRGQVWDVVRNGVCVSQMAGPNGAKQAAERIARRERRSRVQ